MENKQSEYRNIIRELISNLEDAIQFWILFNNIKEVYLVKEYSKSLYLIQAIRNSSLVSFVVQLSKLIDKKGVSINNTIIFLNKNPTLFDRSTAETKTISKNVAKILQKHEHLINKIIQQRNRYHVHTDTRDIKESALKVFHEHNFQLSEIEPFLKGLISCIQELDSLFREEDASQFYNSLVDSTIKDFIEDRSILEKKLNIAALFEKQRNK